MAKITLDAKTFQALASSTRLTVLRALDERRKTLTELARDMDLNKATVHEHLQLLTAAGLVKKRDDEGRKWIYYELTWTGEKLLHPQETTTFSVLLGLSVLAAGGGVGMLGRALGWWLASHPVATSQPETTDVSKASGPADNAALAADSDATVSSTSAAPEAGTTSPGPAPAAGSGGGGGAGGSPPPSPTPAPTPTASPTPAATPTPEHTPVLDQQYSGSQGILHDSSTDQGAASDSSNFFDDGGWLGLVLVAAALIFTALAFALRQHLRPARFVPPSQPEEPVGPDPPPPPSPPTQ